MAGLDELIELARPHGISAEDRLLLRHLSASDVAKAVRRLTAISSWSKKEMDAADAAAAADLSVPQFYKIARDWRVSGDLSNLGVRSGPIRSRASRLGEARGEAAVFIDRELAGNAAVGATEIRRRAEADLDRPPSRSTVARLLAERRKWRAGAFAQRLILDSLGLDMLAPSGARLRLLVFLDAGTGLVLKHFEVSEDMGARGYVVMSSSVADWLVDRQVPSILCHDGDVDLDVRIAVNDALGRAAFDHVLRVPSPSGPRTGLLGREAARVLGDRIGGVWAGVGFREEGIGFRTGRRKHLPYEDAAISAAIDADIDRHNEEVLRRLPRAGSIATTQAALDRVRARFSEIDALEEVMAPIEEERP